MMQFMLLAVPEAVHLDDVYFGSLMKRTNKPLSHSEEISIGVGENILQAMRRKVNIILFNSSVADSFICVGSR